MKEIEVILHTKEDAEAKPLKIAENATIGDLVQALRKAGAPVGDSVEDLTLWIDDNEVRCRKHQKLHECGIRHGHHVHCHPRAVTIIVNTRPKKWSKREISYEEVVILAFGSYSEDPNVVYTVTFSKGPDHKREGSMVKGQSVKVKEGMVFNVTQTNKS